MSDNAAPRLLLTRPRAASERFAAACRAALGPDLDIAVHPLMEIVPLGTAPDLDGVAGLVFTSAAGVAAFSRATDRRDLPAWCVGRRTRAEARDIGLRATSADGSADDLVAAMLRERPPGRWLHLHGVHARGHVAARLAAGGLDVGGVAIYDQARLRPGRGFHAVFDAPGRVVAPVFSPRSAGFLASALAARRPASLWTVAIGMAVRDALPRDMRDRCRVAPSPDAPAMIGAIRALISPAPPLEAHDAVG